MTNVAYSFQNIPIIIEKKHPDIKSGRVHQLLLKSKSKQNLFAFGLRFALFRELNFLQSQNCFAKHDSSHALLCNS